MNKSLAVVIPAYKTTFFNSTLQSLANQTNKNFSVYIGDDYSPNNVAAIVDQFRDQLNIHYLRFDNNIGAQNLVDQWKRCVELTQHEKWLWLFSDDDVADSNCIEIFYKTIDADKEKFDVYRFNTRMINQIDEVVAETEESPFVESSYDMTIELLKLKRGNSIVDHIFSKEIYRKKGGFVHTDFAQGADWATSILFSTEKGLCTMQGAKVNWRLSEQNLSGKAAYTNKMLLGHLQFCNWLAKHFSYLKKQSTNDYNILKKNIEANLQSVIKSHYKGLYFFMYKDVYRYYTAHNNLVNSLFLTLRLYAVIKLSKLLSYK